MASGNISRANGGRSKCYSTVTIVTLLGFCMIGIWMLMSSYTIPIEDMEFSSLDTENEVKVKATKSIKGRFALSLDDSQIDGETETNSDAESSSNTNDEDTSSNDEESSHVSGDLDNEVEKSNSDGFDQAQESLQTNVNESEDNTGEDAVNSEHTEGSDENSKQEDEDNAETKQDEASDDKSGSDKEDKLVINQNGDEVFPSGDQSEILKETTIQNGPWSTQAAESAKEKESQESVLSMGNNGHKWRLCNTSAGPDYIPCLDNLQAIRKLPTTMHYEHRERHCPEEAPSCLVPLPEGYKQSIKWPKSREQIWYSNVPHAKLAKVKGHQNWVKVTGEYLTFPGGGTQFKNGALHYIDFVQNSLPKIAWGKRTRVILDVGCGVASFGGYLFERDVLAMSLAPKDEHEAQVQFALERGIPAFSAVMGTKRLPFPSKVFDVVHCARCRVPWHIEGGKLLLELNRVLRPGGYFVWSATPVYRNDPENAGIWKAMSELTKSMCWELVVIKQDKLNEVGAAIFRKPTSNDCYDGRAENEPPICKEADDPDAAWNVELQACMHKIPTGGSKRGSRWPEVWPKRLEKPPYWLKSSELGVYGKSAPEDFTADYDHWKTVVSRSYLKGFDIDWSSVRNVMDMKAVYGGFAAALKDLKIWVMNIVPIHSPDTLPVIFERGLFGMYHDWCESFSTYPRSYDLLHADHLFSEMKERCSLEGVIAEVDRILRPKGKLIVRDNSEMILELEKIARSLHWKVKFTFSKNDEGLLCVEKTQWRPTQTETIMSAIA
nr:probable methyltransferase PMT24 [Ipomoea batatas]